MDEEIKQRILENMTGPKKVTGDAGSVEQHSLKEQIDFDRYIASKEAAGQGGGIRFTKLKPDGTV